jgi:ABC-2 type transport system ATP-binding protein
MIEIKNVTKYYGRKKAVDAVSFEIQDGIVFGLLGTNGAGKSTLLRVMAGILKPEHGDVVIDGESVFENPEAKKNFFYISDNQYFFPNSTPGEMEVYYQSVYPDFDKERFEDYLVKFHLGKGSKINSYSKGMKRQLAILLAICSNTKYIFFQI